MPRHSNPGCKTRSPCLPPPPRVAAVLRASEGHGSPVLARTSCGASQTLNSVSGQQHPTHRITVNTPSHAGQHRQHSSHPPPDQQKLWVNGVRYPMGSALVFCPWHYRTTACHLQASAPLLAGGLLPFITAAFRVASTQLGGGREKQCLHHCAMHALTPPSSSTSDSRGPRAAAPSPKGCSRAGAETPTPSPAHVLGTSHSFKVLPAEPPAAALPSSFPMFPSLLS